MSTYTPSGRLGDPNMDLNTDPRANPKLVKALAAFGLDKRQPQPDLTVDSPLSEITALMAQFDAMFGPLYDNLPLDLSSDKHEPKIVESEVMIKGVDGNDIKLHVFRKAGTEGEVMPGVLYMHGGGMAVISTYNPVHNRWCTSLALAGTVAISVDFRNSYTKEGHNPFPAGLNDCAAAAQYIAAHKSDFRISKLTLQGESGGGNLALATALKANKEGWIHSIAGVFGYVPYISYAWGWPEDRLRKELPSCVENNGHMIGIKTSELMGHYYTPTKEDSTNPLAWPYHATEEELRGLPPHRLVMDELDPLRDEGMAYYRKLVAAGVEAAAQVNLGVTHAAGLMFRQALPEVHHAVVDSVVAFAKRV